MDMDVIPIHWNGTWDEKRDEPWNGAWSDISLVLIEKTRWSLEWSCNAMIDGTRPGMKLNT